MHKVEKKKKFQDFKYLDRNVYQVELEVANISNNL